MGWFPQIFSQSHRTHHTSRKKKEAIVDTLAQCKHNGFRCAKIQMLYDSKLIFSFMI